jgi:hypothetical protein
LLAKPRRATGNGRAPEAGEEGWCAVMLGAALWGWRWKEEASALSRAERKQEGYRWLARKARCATGNGRAPEAGEEGWCAVMLGVALLGLGVE